MAMKEMIEVRFHSRAGQGAKTASEMFADALMGKGFYVQSFPEYGAARQGAPMAVFLRVYDKPIKTHSNIYNPHIVVVLDDTLLADIDVCDGIKKEGKVIISTKRKKEDVLKMISTKEGKIFTVDASGIAVQEFGVPITNTPILGALVKVSGFMTLDEIKKILIKKFTAKFGEEIMKKNMRALERGFNEVK